MKLQFLIDVDPAAQQMLASFKCQQTKTSRRFHLVMGSEEKRVICNTIEVRGLRFEFAALINCKYCRRNTIGAIKRSLKEHNQPFDHNSVDEMRVYWEFLEEIGDRKMMRLVSIQLAWLVT